MTAGVSIILLASSIIVSCHTACFSCITGTALNHGENTRISMKKIVKRERSKTRKLLYDEIK